MNILPINVTVQRQKSDIGKGITKGLSAAWRGIKFVPVVLAKKTALGLLGAMTDNHIEVDKHGIVHIASKEEYRAVRKAEKAAKAREKAQKVEVTPLVHASREQLLCSKCDKAYGDCEHTNAWPKDEHGHIINPATLVPA